MHLTAVALCAGIVAVISTNAIAAEEFADQKFGRITKELLTALHSDNKSQNDNSVIAAKIIEREASNIFNYRRMAAMSIGSPWRQANQQQQDQLTAEFKVLITRTYSKALSSAKSTNIESMPLRVDPDGTEAVAAYQFVNRGGKLVQLVYYLEKTSGSWKAYDITISGVSLVTEYRSQFVQEIRNGGFDGLISTLTALNSSQGFTTPQNSIVTADIGQASTKQNQTGGAASNCPKEVTDDREYTKVAMDGETIQFYEKRVTDNDWHPGYRGRLSDKGLEHLYCVENDGKFYKQVCRMFQCFNNTSVSSSSTQATQNSRKAQVRGDQLNDGSASEIVGRRANRKSDFNPGGAQALSSQSASSNSAVRNEGGSKAYVSKDVTHCVEVVPKGFKGCTYSRCLHNACGLEKISVWWHVSGAGDSLVDLAPSQNWPVKSIFDDGGPLHYSACSWDKKAVSGPHRNPCHY